MSLSYVSNADVSTTGSIRQASDRCLTITSNPLPAPPPQSPFFPISKYSQNPNEPQEQDLVHGVRLERNRFKNIEWTAYEAVHKKYLILASAIYGSCVPSVLVGAEGYFSRLRSNATPFTLPPTIPQNSCQVMIGLTAVTVSSVPKLPTAHVICVATLEGHSHDVLEEPRKRSLFPRQVDAETLRRQGRANNSDPSKAIKGRSEYRSIRVSSRKLKLSGRAGGAGHLPYLVLVDAAWLLLPTLAITLKTGRRDDSVTAGQNTKPRVKSHFRAHRLSFWLNLVPDLHRPGGDDVPPSHHLLDDHDHGAPRVGATPPPSRTPKGGTLGTTPGLAGQRGGAILGNASGTSQSLLPSVVESSGTTPPSHEPEDGFAAYSTALSLTIAIGCSLLILNVMVFAGVYYRRDKTRLHQEGEAANDGDKRNENGRMPNSICADLLVTGGGDARSEVVAAVKLSDHGSHHIHSRHNQYQLPEFSAPASHDNSSKTLPKPPPPPRTVKPPTTSPSKPNLLQGCGCAPESQPLLPSHNLQHLNAALGGGGGTLKKKHENKTQDKTSVEDLRV
uniref:Uncharacterized protein n=1 Tax=Timema monikensis TaxID=170555 RepID=A0A7R9HLH5_9NEOP|nr:unnamed protein product [Timema monikensis]